MKHPKPLAHVALLAALLAFGVSVSGQTKPVPTHDLESWNDLQITAPINKKNDFTIQGTMRIGDNISQPVDERLGVGWVFKANKYLSFLPSYFHREARPPNGKHENEDRLNLAATVRFPIGKFTLMDRNLFEHRWRNPQVNAWRYRNRLQLEHPFQINKTKFTLFFFDEVFHDWSLHVWPRNRFSVGVMHSFNPHLTLELYYTRQNDGRTRPGDLNIIWTTWRVHL